MTVSAAGINFIKYLQKEKPQLGFYWLMTHISIYEEAVNGAITVDLKQHQFDALEACALLLSPPNSSRND